MAGGALNFHGALIGLTAQGAGFWMDGWGGCHGEVAGNEVGVVFLKTAISAKVQEHGPAFARRLGRAGANARWLGR